MSSHISLRDRSIRILFPAAMAKVVHNRNRPCPFVHLQVDKGIGRDRDRQQGSVLFQEQIHQPLVVYVARLKQEVLGHMLESRLVKAHDINAAYIELLAFIDVNVEPGRLAHFIDGGVRDKSKVEMAELEVGLAQVIEALPN